MNLYFKSSRSALFCKGIVEEEVRVDEGATDRSSERFIYVTLSVALFEGEKFAETELFRCTKQALVSWVWLHAFAVLGVWSTNHTRGLGYTDRLEEEYLPLCCVTGVAIWSVHALDLLA